MARSLKGNAVWILALTLIFGSMVFVLTNPELMSLASGGQPPMFRPGDCVTGNFAFPGEEWVIVERLNFAAETYLVEEASGRQQAIQATRIQHRDTEQSH